MPRKVRSFAAIPFKFAQVTAIWYLGFAEHRGTREAVTMSRLGRCTLLQGQAGAVLDRLAGLHQVIQPQALQQVLLDTGRVNRRRCPLTHEVALWVVLAMGILTDLPIRQVFKHARRFRAGERTPGRSNLCAARKRLGVPPLRRLFYPTARPLATAQTPGRSTRACGWWASTSCGAGCRSVTARPRRGCGRGTRGCWRRWARSGRSRGAIGSTPAS